MAAVGAFVEGRHRFIGRSNLKLIEVGLSITAVGLTIDFSLINVIPSTLTTKNVVDFLSFNVLSVIDLKRPFYRKLVWAGAAFKPQPVITCNPQHISAIRAERQHLISIEAEKNYRPDLSQYISKKCRPVGNRRHVRIHARHLRLIRHNKALSLKLIPL